MAVRAVPVTLNGQEHLLRLDMGAMAALEDQGYEVEELIGFLGSGKLSAKRLRVLLWGMLQHEDNPPTLKEVGRWVDGENFTHVVGKISETLALAFPKPSKESPGPQHGVGIGVKSNALEPVSP